MSTPTLEDARKAIAYAEENMRLGDQAADDAERHGRYQQAAAAYGNAGRIIAAAIAMTAPPEPHRWGVAMNYGGAPSASAALAGVLSPGPR
jgi:hypothetical protein